MFAKENGKKCTLEYLLVASPGSSFIIATVNVAGRSSKIISPWSIGLWTVGVSWHHGTVTTKYSLVSLPNFPNNFGSIGSPQVKADHMVLKRCTSSGGCPITLAKNSTSSKALRTVCKISLSLIEILNHLRNAYVSVISVAPSVTSYLVHTKGFFLIKFLLDFFFVFFKLSSKAFKLGCVLKLVIEL